MASLRRRALAAALAACLLAVAAAAAEATATVRVTVKNLACPRCAGAIRKALLAEPGVASVDASVPDQRFTLAVRGAGPDDARLRAVVERDGVVVVGIQRD
jgi:copper chaperone CopZ